MPKIVKTYEVPLKRKKTPVPEYSWEASENLGESLNLIDFCCNIRSLEKGKFSYPYHFHHNAEELFVILSGKGELRTPEGIQHIQSGDIGIFEKGETGAHQLYNPNPEPLLYLDLRTLNKADICEYPDSGKVNILPKLDIFIKGADAEYFDGEQHIGEIWEKQKQL